MSDFGRIGRDPASFPSGSLIIDSSDIFAEGMLDAMRQEITIPD